MVFPYCRNCGKHGESYRLRCCDNPDFLNPEVYQDHLPVDHRPWFWILFLIGAFGLMACSGIIARWIER